MRAKNIGKRGIGLFVERPRRNEHRPRRFFAQPNVYSHTFPVVATEAMSARLVRVIRDRITSIPTLEITAATGRPACRISEKTIVNGPAVPPGCRLGR